MPQQKLPYNAEIAKRVRELTRVGVPVDTIFAEIQKYQDSPGSLTTFYKLYRMDREMAKAGILEAVGGKVMNQAVNGDDESGITYKYRELVLRSLGEWSPKSTAQTREVGTDAEEEESAVDALMKALGKSAEE